MFKLLLFFLYIFSNSFLVFSSDLTSTEYDSKKYLSRYSEDTETCRYYPMTSTISLNEDKVFSPEYENINGEVNKQVKFLEGPTRLADNATFISVILSATGVNNNRFKRAFDRLYVREEEDGTPTILINQEEDSKILVFSNS